ncbi:PAS-domain containing protein [Roseibium sp.]|uniref:PAS-domain containing protein n=1 Tax=Roseibium sp. TaxID=1936156 RepID=UPI003A98863B
MTVAFADPKLPGYPDLPLDTAGQISSPDGLSNLLAPTVALTGGRFAGFYLLQNERLECLGKAGVAPELDVDQNLAIWLQDQLEPASSDPRDLIEISLPLKNDDLEPLVVWVLGAPVLSGMLLLIGDTPPEEHGARNALTSLLAAAVTLLEHSTQVSGLEQQLEQEVDLRDFFNQFNELAGMGGWEIDGETREVRWTPQTCRIHDLPEGTTLKLQEWFQLCNPDCQPILESAFKEALRSGSGWELKLQITTAMGRDVWVYSVCQPIFEPGRKRPRLVGAVTDITSQVQMESEVATAERLYRSTLDALTEGILVADREGVLRWYNAAAETILEVETLYEGLSHLASIATEFAPDYSLAEEDGLSAIGGDELVERLLSGRESMKWNSLSRIGVNRQRKWLKCHSEPLINDESGELVGVVISINDVTQQKHTEDMLNEVFEAVPSGFAIYDQDDKLYMANAAYRFGVLSGVGIKKCRGQTFHQLMTDALVSGQFPDAPSAKPARDSWIEEWRNGFFMGEPTRLERLSDGRWIQSTSQITPSSYRADFFADVTELKEKASVLKAIFDYFPAAVALITADMEVTYFNSKWMKLLHFQDGEVGETVSLSDMLHNAFKHMGSGEENLAEEVARSTERLRLIDGAPFERKFADGTIFRVSGRALPGGNILTFVEDITESRNAAEELQAKEKLAREKSEELEHTFENINLAVSVFDREGRLQTWNDKYVEYFNKQHGEARRGISLFDLIEVAKARGNFQGDVKAHVDGLIARLNRGEVVHSRFRMANGRILKSNHSPLPGGGWIGTHSVLLAGDDDGSTSAGNAGLDDETGLHDQAWAMRSLDETLRTIHETEGHGVLSIVRVGRTKASAVVEHCAKDRRMLRAVTQNILGKVRGMDKVARLDSGEFLVIFPQVQNSRRVVKAVSRRTLTELRSIQECKTEDGTNPISIGVVRLTDDMSTAQEAFQVAMKACDAAYAGGGGFTILS